MIRSTANGLNQISHTASLTTIILLETGTSHFGSFTSIIMSTAELKLEHDLLASNWNYEEICVYQENEKFSNIFNRIEKLTT